MQYRLPDPANYHDPIRYFRDSHGIIASAVDALEKVIIDSERDGINMYLAAHPEVREIIYFFTNIAHIHERDEERTLFPVLRPKISTLGFHLPDTTPAFLVKEHEELNHRARIIARAWEEFMRSGKTDVENELLALQNAKELVALYREHLADENNLIYKVAHDELLTPQERGRIMSAIKDEHDQEVITPLLSFDKPNFSSEL